MSGTLLVFSAGTSFWMLERPCHCTLTVEPVSFSKSAMAFSMTTCCGSPTFHMDQYDNVPPSAPGSLTSPPQAESAIAAPAITASVRTKRNLRVIEYTLASSSCAVHHGSVRTLKQAGKKGFKEYFGVSLQGVSRYPEQKWQPRPCSAAEWAQYLPRGKRNLPSPYGFLP